MSESSPRLVVPHDLASRLEPVDAPVEVPGELELREAAVIALLLREVARAPRLVLIERSGSLRAHAGQVAFPGGKPEPADGSLLATAIREAREEVGLPEQGTQVLGRLDPVPTPTGFAIVPFVGWAPDGWQPRATSGEVAAVLTPGLEHLADPSVHRITGRGVWHGYPYEMHEFAIHKPPVWGATARMVWDLLARMR